MAADCIRPAKFETSMSRTQLDLLSPDQEATLIGPMYPDHISWPTLRLRKTIGIRRITLWIFQNGSAWIRIYSLVW